MCEKMVMKAKEAPRTEDASGILQSVPVQTAAGAMVPVRADALSHSAYTISRLRDSVARVEAAHSHFPDAYSAAAHAHAVGKWEALPMNSNHGSERHHHNGRLFEKLNSILE